MRVLARQLSPLIENIHLVTQLRQHAEDLEQRVIERTAELNTAMERSQAILASVGEGVIVIDLIGRIQTVNEAYERQSGYQNSELTGNSIWSLYEIADVDLMREHINKALEHSPIWTGEQMGKRKSGGSYDVQLTISPLRNPNGEIYGFVGSQRDVTRQKELDRLKDLFVSDVSHELRTPTTNIGLYLELLETATDDRRNGYVNILKEQTQLLIKLVEDILDLSRLSSGKARDIEFSEIDLNQLAREVVIAHMPLADVAGLTLSFVPSQIPAIVHGEINQLSRVVTNLVYNALNYTVQGHVKVKVMVSDQDIFLEVQDTGIGIDEEDLPHIFERFYRGKRVRQTKKHGTGLGLSIVKEIIERHAGTIQIQSRVGQGSTFTVKLPSMERQKWPEKLF
jgi:PAS domain S-box-containing protein